MMDITNYTSTLLKVLHKVEAAVWTISFKWLQEIEV